MSMRTDRRQRLALSAAAVLALTGAAWAGGALDTAKPSPDAIKLAPDVGKPGPDALKPAADAVKPGGDALKPGVDALKPGPDALKLASSKARAPADAAPRSVAPGRDRYRLRCWQYGRLLFEESIAEIPAALAARGSTLPGADPGRGSLLLLDTPGGLCLVKPSDPVVAALPGRALP